MTPPEKSRPAGPGRWTALAVLATSTFLGMSCWFSASAVLPLLRREWELDAGASAWMTIAVQLGFVASSLLAAILNLPDLVPPRRLMLLGALAAAIVNGGIALCQGPGPALFLRFLTGAGLAFVYPPSLKVTATWFRRDRGLAMGVMIGALTLGSALPHLLNAVGGADWRMVLLGTSLLTAAGGLLAEFGARDGPDPFPMAVFDPRQAMLAFRNPGVRLASLGYFGHMWELYAMWSWCGAFFAHVIEREGGSPESRLASLAAFGAIGAGAAGCLLAGRWGDRLGRTWVTTLSLVCSGACAAIIGQPWLPLGVVLSLGLVWGFWVVADSAQFSAIVTETADQHYVGTALTLQLALGFTLTVVTIWLVPWVRDAHGWAPALALLAVGPVMGAAAMLRLRSLPISLRIAGGRR